MGEMSWVNSHIFTMRLIFLLEEIKLLYDYAMLKNSCLHVWGKTVVG